MKLNQEFRSTPHRRYNPLTGDWVLVSPHRTQRPWQGQVEAASKTSAMSYDPECYLCPGNSRAGGARNPQYLDTFVFDNDFSALKPDIASSTQDIGGNGLMLAQSEAGLCRVVCFSPRHDLTLAEMETRDIRKLVDVWAEQYRDLGARNDVGYVQIFENRGAVMGCSNPHPHGQIWASQRIPNEPGKEQNAFRQYQQRHKRCLLCDYMKLEENSGERIICENQHFIAVVPFWATWPFETLVISREHAVDLLLPDPSRDALADILKRMTTRYDNLFQTSFPYSMGFHQRPTNGGEHPEWHVHAHFYPPLLRSATVKKFMVGYEMLASPQRDITPESAAERLRALPEEHF
jgi:UDPglucose--hexose-1-phosphate uridylyltransferase